MRARRRLPFFILVLLLALPAGCKRNDLVENELRERDKQYQEVLEELGKAEHRTIAMEREIAALRHGRRLPRSRRRKPSGSSASPSAAAPAELTTTIFPATRPCKSSSSRAIPTIT